jgi:Sec-independent protein translocase protein TatA
MLLWLGPTDMAAIFVVALLLFGPEQLPKVARQVGEVMRHMQNTTQSFMLEMDRAAREHDVAPAAVAPHADALSAEMPSGDAPNTDDQSAAHPSAAPPSDKPSEEQQ